MTRLLMILLLTASLLTFAQNAQAACTTHTYTLHGRFMTCTTCCNSFGHCTTNCF